MNLFDKIFYKKEYVSVVGGHSRNFWILYVVFLGAIGAIEFSRAGQDYLNHIMDDPFVHWIEVQRQGSDFNHFSEQMKVSQSQYKISAIEDNYYLLNYFYTKNHERLRASGRTIAHNSDLLTTILDVQKNGAITNVELPLQQTNIGLILTKELMANLGYVNSEEYPLFVDYAILDSLAETGWITPYEPDFTGIPIPIIAVVDKLPNRLDYMATQQFFYQWEDHSYNPFKLSSHSNYFNKIVLVSTNSSLEQAIYEVLSANGFNLDNLDISTEPYYECWRPATRYHLTFRSTDIVTKGKINDAILASLGDRVCRVYDYQLNPNPEINKHTIDYISFSFDDLSAVPMFAKIAKESDVRVDMALIKSKENVTTFNFLIKLLCSAILFLSIVFLAIFIWFLIDSHFKSISKNLGTIMAFGLSNRTIVRLYLDIFLTLIICALLGALFTLAFAELACRLFDFAREEGYYYFVMNDRMVILTALCLPVLSAVVVYVSMLFKLNATPGDLIFERD